MKFSCKGVLNRTHALNDSLVDAPVKKGPQISPVFVAGVWISVIPGGFDDVFSEAIWTIQA
mgnify:CR=1 FL=1|jgi:hypothetical protein